ncbi:MAG: hypothetical protein R3F28_19230 [Candidatus Kapaibacterium sp.]
MILVAVGLQPARGIVEVAKLGIEIVNEFVSESVYELMVAALSVV